MKSKIKIKNKVKCILYDRPKLNRKFTCIKRSFDEVIQILNPRCKC